MSEPVPFCQRNIKLWLSALIVLALFVLGYATWLAWERGEVSGFTVQEKAGEQVAAASPGPAQPMPVAMQPMPVAMGQGAMIAAQGVALNRPIDAISRATPNGGIQFIGGNQAVSIQTSFNLAADIIRPAVVNVNAVRSGPPVQTVAANGARFIDPFDGVPDKVVGQVAYESVGSGVIIDPRGYVVTNLHVVAGATSIVVTRFNEPQNFLPTRVVATDTANDIAMLQVMGPGPFPAASLADSSLVEVGDWVIAVGNPFGLEHTVTAGIISARRSAIAIDNVIYNGLLQTDAPINRGSSGGPLVNLQGKVVGVNTAIYAPTGVFNGTGFAIPSNRVSSFVARILGDQGTAMAVAMPQALPAMPAAMAMQPMLAAMQPGAIQTAPVAPAGGNQGIWIGVGVIDVTPELAKALSFPFAGGVFVNSVILDSPADEAQITRGDIITSFAGTPIARADALSQVIAALVPGQPVPVSLWRGGKTESTKITPKVSRPLGK